MNILTGHRAPLVRALATHGDVDCIDLTGCGEPAGAGKDRGGTAPAAVATEAEQMAAETVTRVVRAAGAERHWLSESAQSPYAVSAFCEYKTVWHPKGR